MSILYFLFFLKSRHSIGHGIPMVATSPIQNDLSNLSTSNQVEIQTTSNIYQNNWKNVNEYGLGGGLLHNLHKSPYEDMMNFGSDEEDCFDNLSGNDDSVSSVGMDETRIQQL
jgi:hypothetical protein